MIRMLNPPMRRFGLARSADPPRASPAERRSLRLACFAAIAVLVLLTAAAATPDLAGAAGKISKQDLKESCLKAPGSHWHESGDGSYGCWIGGFRTECTKDGACKQYCYEEFGCTCNEWPGVTCVRKPQIKPVGSGDPGQVVDQGPVSADADASSSSPSTQPEDEPASSRPRILPVGTDQEDENHAA